MFLSIKKMIVFLVRSLDPHSLHLITQFQFRESINNAFNMRVTDKQFQELLYDVGTTEDGLVPYPGFLAIFNKKRYSILFTKVQ